MIPLYLLSIYNLWILYIYIFFHSFETHLLYIMSKKISLTLFQKIIFITALGIGLWLFLDILRQRTDFLKRFSLEGFENSGIGNTDSTDQIRKHKIKASANSALDIDETIVLGSDSDERGLFKVISRGVRFFDFEIYSIEDSEGANRPEIGYSTSSDFSSLQTNTVPVADALDKIMECAFTSPAPNPSDPVFIQFRMKSAKKEIYDLLADELVRCCGSRLIRDISGGETELTDGAITLQDISGGTELSKIKNKIIVIVCTTNANKNSSNPSIKTIKIDKIFTDQTNVTKLYKCGEKMVFHKHIEEEEQIFSNPYNISDLDLSINMPGVDSNFKTGNIQYEEFKNDSSNNIVPYKFYSADESLIEYEEYFRNNGTAFVVKS